MANWANRITSHGFTSATVLLIFSLNVLARQEVHSSENVDHTKIII